MLEVIAINHKMIQISVFVVIRYCNVATNILRVYGYNYKYSVHILHGRTLRNLAHAIHRDFFQKKKIHCIFFLNIFAQSIHCGYTLEPPCQGCSNEYPQCTFWIKNKVYPCKPEFFYIKWDKRGYLFHGDVFLMKS